MSTGTRGRSTESSSAAVGGSEVPGVHKSDSSTGPLPVHLRTEGATEKYDWRGSRYHHASGADKRTAGGPAEGAPSTLPDTPTVTPPHTATPNSHTAMPTSHSATPTSHTAAPTPPHTALSTSPAFRHPHPPTHPSTGPLLSRPQVHAHLKVHSKPGPVDLTNPVAPHTEGAATPDSPTYSSGNISSGELAREVREGGRRGREGGGWREGG
jgi:hypothetical protein